MPILVAVVGVNIAVFLVFFMFNLFIPNRQSDSLNFFHR